MSKMSNITDSCPKWAIETIEQLRQVEIYLGNIPKALAWESSHLADVMKRTFNKDEAVFSEEKADLIFRKIVKGLLQDGFTSHEIAEFVNSRIGYQGGPRYCNSQDVEEAAQT